MKSIRWSLIFYVLLLLGLSIGGAAAFVFPTTARALDEKNQATKKLLFDHYDKQEKEIKEKFDKELLSQARNVANLARFQPDWMKAQQQQISKFVFALSPRPRLSLLDSIESTVFLVDSRFPYPMDIQIDEQEAFRDVLRPEEMEYFQINSNLWKVVSRSKSLGDHIFPFDVEKFRKKRAEQGREWVSENVELEPGHVVWCVTLETRMMPGIFRGAFLGNRPPPTAGVHSAIGLAAVIAWNRVVLRLPPGGFGQPAQGQPPRVDQGGRGRVGPPERPPTPMFYVQFAADTTQLDEDLSQLRATLSENVAGEELQSRETLASLRNRILLISLVTFAAAVMGGYWLVRLGLAPLGRLSKAVGRVSAKDFHLPFDEPDLPRELRPIVSTVTHTLDQLKRAFAREKQAAADISHELRTPLAALMTSTEVALRKPRKPEEYREVLEDCRASGLRMSQLVERLLALARLDAGVDTLRPREVDVATLAEQCVGTVRPLAEAHKVNIRLHHLGDTQVTTDPDKLGEVLTNLLHNAIQYNRQPGSIDLSVIRNNGNLDVEVRDTGIGIAADKREHIFERFYRADPSRQADQCNSGLGLAIVKGYVDLMGGTISVESVEGEGSTFRVVLPVHEPEKGDRIL